MIGVASLRTKIYGTIFKSTKQVCLVQIWSIFEKYHMFSAKDSAKIMIKQT